MSLKLLGPAAGTKYFIYIVMMSLSWRIFYAMAVERPARSGLWYAKTNMQDMQKKWRTRRKMNSMQITHNMQNNMQNMVKNIQDVYINVKTMLNMWSMQNMEYVHKPIYVMW